MFDWTEAVIDTVVLIGSYEHDVPGPVFTFNPAVPGRAILEFTATLTGSLPAGKYTYRVQATKPSGRRTLLHSALWLAESNFDSDTIPPGPSIHPGGDSFVDFSLIFENHLI